MSSQAYTTRDIRLRNIIVGQRIQNLAKIAIPKISEHIDKTDQEIEEENVEENAEHSLIETEEYTTDNILCDIIESEETNNSKLKIVDNNLFILTMLEQILREENARIQEWFQRFGRELTLENVTSRKNLYKTLEDVVYYNAKKEFKSRSKIIELPSGGLTYLRYFSPIHCIFSLLTDGRINAFKNTIFKYLEHEANHTRIPSIRICLVIGLRTSFPISKHPLVIYMMIYKKQMEKHANRK